jgi:hypothetical protein
MSEKEEQNGVVGNLVTPEHDSTDKPNDASNDVGGTPDTKPVVEAPADESKAAINETIPEPAVESESPKNDAERPAETVPVNDAGNSTAPGSEGERAPASAPNEPTKPHVVTPDKLPVNCAECKKEYDFTEHGRTCPYCGNIRRGRAPSKSKVPDVDEGKKAEDGKPKFNRKQAEPVKAKFTLEMYKEGPNQAQLDMARLPVYAIHMTIAKKRGYGLTKDEFEAGQKNVGYLIQKYDFMLIDYMPEILTAVWLIKVIAMPEVSAAQWAEMQKEATKNGSSS